MAFLGPDDGKPSPTGRLHGPPRLESKTNTKTSKLSDLPPELIILIASMLPTQSAACLSLCSQATSQILGPNVWRCLSLQNPGMRASFLCDLSKDLPQYFVCYRCAQLHSSNAVQWPRITPKTLTRCLGKEPVYWHCSQSGLLLRFPHIQLAMNRHHLGPSYGFPLEGFQNTEVIESDLFRNIILLSIDAQIVSNELLIRSQQWILLPHDRRNEFVTVCLFHHICHHIWDLGKSGDNLPALIKSRLDLLEEQGQCCTSTSQCLKCPMDFVIDAVDLGERGTAGCLTRWINLGAGLHPADPKWGSHLGKPLPKGVPYEPHILGSIRSSFENQTTVPCKDFTARKMADLCQGVNASSLLTEQMSLFGNWLARTRIGGVWSLQSKARGGVLLAFLNSCQVNIGRQNHPLMMMHRNILSLLILVIFLWHFSNTRISLQRQLVCTNSERPFYAHRTNHTIIWEISNFMVNSNHDMDPVLRRPYGQFSTLIEVNHSYK